MATASGRPGLEFPLRLRGGADWTELAANAIANNAGRGTNAFGRERWGRRDETILAVEVARIGGRANGKGVIREEAGLFTRSLVDQGGNISLDRGYSNEIYPS